MADFDFAAYAKLGLVDDDAIDEDALEDDEDLNAELAALDLDLLLVVAYGLILPADVLAAPRYGCVNVHASLLPRWRGAARLWV